MQPVHGKLDTLLPADCILYDEPMAVHTTFRTGGPADLFVTPQTESQLVHVLRILRAQGIPATVIGRGSNLLVADRGVRGAVVRVPPGYVEERAGLLRAGAGITLKQLFESALALGYTGLEFASGIPGTLGGGVVMNAGAYGGELKDVIRSVRLLTPHGEIVEYAADDMEFGYRHSVVPESGLIVLSADLALPRGDTKCSREQAAALAARRRDRQPLEHASAGSTFRRPPGRFAGTLIQSCGLKGARIGQAQVSKKHAGFIVNLGSARAAEIRRLISEVQRTVYAFTGVRLEPEVKFLGEF